VEHVEAGETPVPGELELERLFLGLPTPPWSRLGADAETHWIWKERNEPDTGGS
jgi:hypothetical protein